MLATALEADDALAQQVLGSLDAIFYAGAALTPAVWDRLETLCATNTGQRVPILSSRLHRDGPGRHANPLVCGHAELDRSAPARDGNQAGAGR